MAARKPTVAVLHKLTATTVAAAGVFPSPVDAASLTTMELPRSPRPKTPEDLARELEERLRAEAVRTAQWRRRRAAYRIVTLSAGLLLPALCLSMAGIVSNGGFAAWTDRVGWLPLPMTAGGGLALAAWACAAGWGVARGMMGYGGVFMLVVVCNQARLGTLVIAMPGLVALFVCAGALVGYLVVLEEGD